MEFKWQDNYYTLKEYNLNYDDLKKIIRKIYKPYLRHPRNDQICLYLNLEFVKYLEEVYFNRNGYYLDLEIAFFEKHFYIGNLKKKIPLSKLSEYIARHW